jgi:hypothetical protein
MRINDEILSDSYAADAEAEFWSWFSSQPIESEADMLDRLNDRLNDEYQESLEHEETEPILPFPTIYPKAA